MRHLLGAMSVLLVAGCAHEAPVVRDSGTVRIFGGKRVAGHYVSPTAYHHYLLAQLASLEARNEDAADSLRRALVSDGSSAYLRARLAEELMAVGRLDEARDQIDAALRIDPELAEAYVDLGRIHLQLGDSPAAERAFRRAFELDRTCEDAYLALAALYEERGDAHRADSVYQTLSTRLPASAQAHFHLARAASRRGDAAQAEAELRKATEIDPTLREASRELAALLLGDGRTDEAVAELRRSWEHTGDVGIAGLLVGAETAAHHGEAATALLDKLADRPGPLGSRLEVGWLFVERHLGPRALAVADAVVASGAASSDQPALRLLRGAALAEVHRTDDALVELRRIGPSAPEYARAQVRLARLLVAEDRIEEAAEGLWRALPLAEKAPDGELVVASLAEVEERRSNRASSLRLLRGAVAARPLSDGLAFALAHLLERGGAWEEAVGVARQLLRRRPDSAEAMNFIGYLEVEHGTRLDEARKLLEAAAGLRPAAGEIADSLGWLYVKLGRLPEAEKHLQRASRLLGDNADVLAHLGAFYLATEDRARALDAYRRALLQKPDDRLRRSVEEQLLLLEKGRVGSR